MTVKAELKALQDQIERDKENTTLARFIRNLESRIYAQLSRQLVENLFGETASESGILELEGNTIEYNGRCKMQHSLMYNAQCMMYNV